MISAGFFKKKYTHLIAECLYYLIFGIFCFYVVYKIFGPEMLYYKLQPYFSLDPSFIEYCFHQQQGYISLISQYLMQLLYYPVSGSILLSLILVLFALQYRFIFNGLVRSLGRGFEFLPPILILIFLKSYTVTLDALVMFFIIGLFVLANRSLRTDNLFLKIAFQLICIYLFISVTGILASFGLLVFIVTDEILLKKTPKKFIYISLDILLFLILAYTLWGFTLASRMSRASLPATIYESIPCYWYLLSIHIIGIGLSALMDVKFSKVFLEKINRLNPGKFLILFIFIVLGIIFSKKLFINESKYNTQIEYYASQKKWIEVLKLKNKTKLQDRISRFLINRALFETGQMTNNLFSVPQEGGEFTLFLTKSFTHECTIYSSDLFYDLGFIKSANYWALEAQTFDPYSPRILKRIALTSLLLKEYSISEKYLTILKESFVERKWASDLLESVHQKNYSELEKTIAFNNLDTTQIFLIENDNPNHILIEMLMNNGKNKMAFEYLESYYLMRNDLKDFYNRLNYMSNFNYQKIPTVYQEAILLYYVSNNIPEEKFEYSIDIDIKNKFLSFYQTLYKYKSNPGLGKMMLQSEFGNTYWYYLQYGSPVTTGKTIKKRKL